MPAPGSQGGLRQVPDLHAYGEIVSHASEASTAQASKVVEIGNASFFNAQDGQGGCCDTATFRPCSTGSTCFINLEAMPAILKHVDGQQGTDNICDTIAHLRRWRRYLSRAQEMRLSLPDPSLQLKGIDLLRAKVLEKSGDVSFRLALARNDLQL